MSSTQRGSTRVEHDYYVTPVEAVIAFLDAWTKDDPRAGQALGGYVYDPCAGGNVGAVEWTSTRGDTFTIPPTPMTYPLALDQLEMPPRTLATNDIRADSPAQWHSDFLTTALLRRPDVIISNPPFADALAFIQHALDLVAHGSFVVMLLRLNFLGSAKRLEFFQKHCPTRIYVHHDRMSFTPDRRGDSVEYAHMVWEKGSHNTHAQLRVI